MNGQIIYEPPASSKCTCGGKPNAKGFRDGTIWKCGTCERRWEKWTGLQHNEYFENFDAWRELNSGNCPRHELVQHRDGKPPWCNTCGLPSGGR